MSKDKKVGRPTKLTEELIEALKEVANDSIYLTDEDLIFLVNEKLPEENRIAIQTFKDYKAGRRQQNSDLIDEFANLIKKALTNEKINLLKKVEKGENGWQSKAWILERKFTEWNLKHISEADITSKGHSLNEISKIRFID